MRKGATTFDATQGASPPSLDIRARVSADDRRFCCNAGLVAAGLAAIGYAWALAALGNYRNDGAIDIATTRRFLVAVSGIAGAAYLIGLGHARGRPARSGDMLIILAVGLVARIILIPSASIFVSDFNRYLWDGAVTASGANPWTHTPESVNLARDAGEDIPGVSPELVELAGKSGKIIHRINHPHLSTIYPATAQAAFAVAYWIKPWSLAALRIVLLVFEASTVLLLAAILRSMNRPLHGIAWYWWNPLLLREVCHSAHMDVIVLPFVLFGFLLAVKGRPGLAGAAMALAVGAKVWPLVLLPLCIRASSKRLKKSLAFLVAFVGVSALLWWPVAHGASAGTSGFLAYAESWHNNDAVFHVIRWLTHHLLVLVALNPELGAPLSRLLVVSLIAWVVFVQARRVGHDMADLIRRSLLVVAVVYFLSPAQFPWYYVWLVPLLAIHPRWSLLAYTVLLPLYYFNHAHPWIKWVEHLPILGWFVMEEVYARVHRPVLPVAGRSTLTQPALRNT